MIALKVLAATLVVGILLTVLEAAKVPGAWGIGLMVFMFCIYFAVKL